MLALLLLVLVLAADRFTAHQEASVLAVGVHVVLCAGYRSARYKQTQTCMHAARSLLEMKELYVLALASHQLLLLATSTPPSS
jgi:hypothetical protein